MAKRAVCVGINDYPGSFNDLNGCVNDANDWASVLHDDFGFGENVTLLTDAEATRDGILAALRDLIASGQAGDLLVFTYSGHGTWEPDREELDEVDNRDEAICAHDGNIIDDELREIIRQLNPGARLTVISDSCHSGTVTRATLRRAYEEDKKAAQAAPKPRYMPPSDPLVAARGMMLPTRRRFLYPESGMTEVLITGCNATEYSYDAFMNDRFNGAMTATTIRLIKSNPRQTYTELHRALRTILPSVRYPQSPQLEGSEENKNRPLFT